MAPRAERILIYDIETAPLVGYAWGVYEQNIIEVIESWYVLCFAYRWLGENKTHVVALPDSDLYKKDPKNDREIITRLHDLFSEADIVVAHNGNKFDQRKSQARMLIHGITPPAPYKQVDTLVVARRYFKLDSNRLDALAIQLGVGRKLPTGGFVLWKGCMDGDEASWRKMTRYNKRDVIVLERVYKALRPWITTHPNLATITHMPEACPKCGKGPLIRRGYCPTTTYTYQRFRCKACGGWSRARASEKEIIKPTHVNTT